ncbi:MAG: S-methyl-5-thioribose-1-phosphate isomerase [Syntrophobacterales bacterium]|nr:MAG: S-methyl-5-thioribose-1-phosphate isomerase [Syntrophobacterales bacterium]
MKYEAVTWRRDKVVMLDQRRLPTEEIYVKCDGPGEVAEAIRNMTIRGAPAIGVAAAMGIALGAMKLRVKSVGRFKEEFEGICRMMMETRPTAANLSWAVQRMETVVRGHEGEGLDELRRFLKSEAMAIREMDIEVNRRIGHNGKRYIRNGSAILTHCNAGALATAGYGTALGVIRAAHEEGKDLEVYACETRPRFQGARLTAWELDKEGIPVTLITDGMSGYLMSKGVIHMVIVGADRISANGDVANKIGTYSLAILAKAHGIPFYVAAPLSTFDLSLGTGDEIPIEERDSREVTHPFGTQIAPEGVRVWNPAFDVTPQQYVTAIITERGVAQEPFEASLRDLFS